MRPAFLNHFSIFPPRPLRPRSRHRLEPIYGVHKLPVYFYATWPNCGKLCWVVEYYRFFGKFGKRRLVMPDEDTYMYDLGGRIHPEVEIWDATNGSSKYYYKVFVPNAGK